MDSKTTKSFSDHEREVWERTGKVWHFFAYLTYPVYKTALWMDWRSRYGKK